MQNLIDALLRINKKHLAKTTGRLTTAKDYAHEVNTILTSNDPKNKKQQKLEALVDSYQAQTAITCPLMQLILKQEDITLENAKKAMQAWRKTGQEPC